MKTKTSIYFLACLLVSFVDANAYNCFGATIPDSMDKFEYYPSLKTWLDVNPDTAHFPVTMTGSGCADKYGHDCRVRMLHASWVFSQIHETAEMPMKERLAAYGEYQKKWAQDPKGEKRYRADGRNIPVLRKTPGGTNRGR